MDMLPRFRCRVGLHAAAASAAVLCAALTWGGDLAPEIAANATSGKPFSLSALKGNVVLLDFWASWCAPCRKSFPFLDRLQERHAAEGLRVVGVSLEEDDDAVAAFLRSVPVSFTIVRDPSQKAGEAYRINAMPTSVLIGRDGCIAARFEGGDPTVHDKIEAAVASLLAGGSLPPGSDVLVATSLEATGEMKAWQRGYLADPIMSLDGDPLKRVIREHIHASKEAASGDGGASGGGCGCN